MNLVGYMVCVVHFGVLSLAAVELKLPERSLYAVLYVDVISARENGTATLALQTIGQIVIT